MIPVRIARLWDTALGIKALVLEPVDGAELPEAAPGSHVDVHLPNGLVRQYSICNGPEDTGHYLLGIKREEKSRGGSAYAHESLRLDDVITIGAPRNNFPLTASGTRHPLLAGGVGITPLLSMARHLAAAGKDFELHYFVRSPDHAAFPEILGAGTVGGRTRLHCGLDAHATRAAMENILSRPGPESHAYVCGPLPFMDTAVEVAGAHAWQDRNIHREYFAAPSAIGSDGDVPFTVEAVRSGKTVRVGAQETIIAALTRSGVTIDVSCEQGICGTCLTRVLKGEPNHRDFFLTDEEKLSNDQMCLCVSRAKGDLLVLDL